MKIFKNIPIRKANLGRHSGMSKTIINTIHSKMEQGDMIETRCDCANIRQVLYDMGNRIIVRWNPETNKYNVWKEA